MARDSVSNKIRLLPTAFACTTILAVAIATLVPVASSRAAAQDSGRDKSLDVKSSVGDMHIGSDADIRETGLPPYPGARLRKHDEHRNSANLALFTSAFGMKLVVMNFDSDDAPGKVIAFYQEQLKKYGKVIECHKSKDEGATDTEEHEEDSGRSKELRCEGANIGPIVELKAGTEDNQHLVAIEPAEKGTGTTFAVVYVRTRGRQGEI
ncbi:MAG: hypothetical protein LAO09_14075 [Acidobacteriia bacterium]|nr:hypothetical protein [Terriglobia bacterium]